MMVFQSIRNNESGVLNDEGVVSGRARGGLVRSSVSKIPHNLRIGSWNVGTLKGRSNEIVEVISRRNIDEVISRRNIDICCIQEVRWRGASTKLIQGKNTIHKLFWIGNDQGTNGVGIFLAEKWIEKVFDIKRISDRIMLIKLILGEEILTVLSVYAPQTGLDNSLKDGFYDTLQLVLAELPSNEIVIPCGDWNGHVGKTAAGYADIHGDFGFGERNEDGERVLDFSVANNLVIGNTFFHVMSFSNLPFWPL